MSKLNDFIEGLSKDKVEQLLALAKTVTTVSKVGGDPLIERRPHSKALPLSFAQQRLWFLTQLEGVSATYHIPVALRLRGSLDKEALRRALDTVFARHEALRTIFVAVDGQPHVELLPAQQPFPLVERDLLDHADPAAALAQFSREEVLTIFDLTRGPLIRASLLRLAEFDHVLLITQHHIISDGWSLGILVKEFSALYAALTQGHSDPLPPLAVQYPDYAAWQREWFTEERLAEQLSYWHRTLADAPVLLTLPTDRPRSVSPSYSGAIVPIHVDAELTRALKQLSQEHGITLFMTLMAAWAAVLARLSGQDDLVIGTPSANRGRHEIEPLVGFFVNTLALRIDLSSEPSVAELLDRIRTITLTAQDHQDVPFEQVVERINPPRRLEHTPLFQVMFAWQNNDLGTLDLPGLQVEPVTGTFDQIRFDLELNLFEVDGTIQGSLGYATDLFDAATIERQRGYLLTFLRTMVEQTNQPLTQIDLLASEERALLLRTWNQTDTPYPVDRCIHQLFEEQAQRNPDATALVFENQFLSYGELNVQANRLAQYLIEQGVRPDALVAICVERSLAMVIGLLAVLKAGGAYVPLDPEHPMERLAQILADADPAIILSDAKGHTALGEATLHKRLVLDLDHPEPVWCDYSAANPDPFALGLTPHHLAYVIYTSGSTGMPKGVMVEHAQVSRLFEATQDLYKFNAQDRWCLFHSYAFDFSVWELWGALRYGGRLILVPSEIVRLPSAFYQLVCTQGITILNQTPSAFRGFIEAQAHDPQHHQLRYVIFGGEALKPTILKAWYARYGDTMPQLVNMYGITETTVHVTYKAMERGDTDLLESPIGQRLPDLCIYLLDAHQQPVPLGAVGELYIGGAGVARGYLHRPDLTAERFLPDPFSPHPKARMYRSGDLARYLPDGNLIFLGRNDHQVKLRGFRIELGEIEAKLRAHPALQDAHVIAKEYADGDQRLIAYIVPSLSSAYTVRQISRLKRQEQTNTSRYLELPNGLTIFHFNKSETEFLYKEIFDDQTYLKHGITLNDDACVFDVGANIGMFSLFVGKNFPKARIYAFEPIPTVFDLLKKNMDIYGLQAHVFKCGLSSEKKQETFTFYPKNTVISSSRTTQEDAHSIVKSFLIGRQDKHMGSSYQDNAALDDLLEIQLQNEKHICQMTTLSDVIREQSIDRIDLLKIDVENAEYDVLQGIGKDDWYKIKQIAIEVHDVGDRLERITNLLQIHGFQINCEQDKMLEGTRLYNIYAIHSSLQVIAREAAIASTLADPPLWTNPQSLILDVRAFINHELPSYMVPSYFIILDSLPLTHNGKFDQKALPLPDDDAIARQAYEPPRGETEATLATIWRELLGLERVGIKDNFFEVGGTSLLAIQLQKRINDRISSTISLIDVFAYPTIETFARSLNTEASNREEVINPSSSRPASTAIAIIGLACRFPDARDAEEFWVNIANGVESLRFYTPEELQVAGVASELIDKPNFVPACTLLDGIEDFDADYFGFTPREAEIADPQQRLLLECAHEALEVAGYGNASGSRSVGVFVGVGENQYALEHLLPQIDAFAALGANVLYANSKDFAATRISYKLNLSGPSVNVNTACSTSLVAVHQACRSLAHGESSMALAGAASIADFSPSGYLYEEGDIQSPDGHCRAFDHDARGTRRGNGVAVVLLKPLDRALADGDTIHAVIQGSAINNDGSDKVGYTAPSMAGQARVIAQAYLNADMSPTTIQYVETHGTGTVLGDPIEVRALKQAFAGTRIQSCAIGSVKPNIGHLNSAAGMAGLIKTTQALKHKQLPPNINYVQANRQIDFASSPFYVNTQLRDWPALHGRRSAGVSSFGIGGTNAHIVLVEAPVREAPSESRSVQLLVISARSAVALQAASEQLAKHLNNKEESESLADVAYTLQVGRTRHAYRRVVTCETKAEAIEELTLPAHVDEKISGQDASVIWMFPGQGTQYVDMGRELYEGEPVFREQLDMCAESLRKMLGMDLREVLYPTEKRREEAREILRQTSIAQPALFAVEYSLARLLQSYGIMPDAMIGHSLGEYVAACLAGVFSLEEGLKLVSVRGRLMQGMNAGRMLSVLEAEERLAPRLSKTGLDLAAVNGSNQCVVSGPIDAIAELRDQLLADGIESRELETTHAFHSEMMEAMLESWRDMVRSILMKAPKIPYISNLSGIFIRGEEATDPEYWVRHLRETVRFGDGLKTLLSPGVSLKERRILVEMGPSGVLSGLARQHGGNHAVISLLGRRGVGKEGEARLLHKGVGQMWMNGVRIDWAGYHCGARRQRIPLPTYPFERRRFWVEAPRHGSQFVPDARSICCDDWFYVPLWQLRSTKLKKSIGRLSETQTWVVMADRGGIGERLVNKLREAGQTAIIVRSGNEFKRIGQNEYQLTADNSQHYFDFVNRIVSDGIRIDHLVHLWSLDQLLESGRTDFDIFEEGQRTGYYSFLFAIKSLINQQIDDPITCHAITCDVFRVTGGESLAPAQSTIIGLCKVVPQEYPNLNCRHIDLTRLGVNAHENEFLEWADARLFNELMANQSDKVVAFRHNERWTQTFKQSIKKDGKVIERIRKNGVYAITGGLGKVGYALAKHLASIGAKIVLIVRDEFPDRSTWDRWIAERGPDDDIAKKLGKLLALEAKGAQVLTCKADVTEETQMIAAFEQAEAHFGHINGVIHCAGQVRDSINVLAEITVDDCRAQFLPKVKGVVILEHILKQRRVDFCVLMSSLSTVLGGVGFGAYAAANAYMDAFSNARHAVGDEAWLSINWDGWQLSESDEFVGLYGVTAQEGAQALNYALSWADVPQVVHSTGDLKIRMEKWVDLSLTKSPGRQIYMRSNPKGYIPPSNDVEKKIVEIWQELLGLDGIGIRDDFFELGGDSLLATRLLSRIRDEFQDIAVDYSLRDFFEMSTIEAGAKKIYSAIVITKLAEKQVEIQQKQQGSEEGFF